MAISHQLAQQLMDHLRDVTWQGAAVRRRLRDPLLGNVAGYGPPVMAVLRRLGPVRTSELAEALQVDLSVTSRHVTALVDAGYVERRPDSEDGRATRLHITTAGEAALLAARDRQTQWLRDTLADWDDERAALVATALGDISERLAVGSVHDRTRTESPTA